MRSKLSQQEFLKRAKHKHANKYNYDKSIYVNCNNKIEILCNSCKNIFHQRSIDHLKGHGCNICACKAKGVKSRNDPQEFIKKLKLKHRDKFDYTESKYINSCTKILIKCNICNNKFWQLPLFNLKTKCCPHCDGKHLDVNYFLENAIKKHKNNYDYSHINFKKLNGKLKIKCNKCNNFFNQTARHHLMGHGCIFCVNLSKTKNISQFIIDAVNIHKKKYNYDKSNYINSAKKIEIKCNDCNLIFWQTPHSHLLGRGCRKCGARKFVSKSENEWLDFLKIKQEFRQQTIIINNKKYIVDAYVAESNTIYEFNGDYWHGNPSLFEANEMNKRNNKTFGELYNKTLNRENLLKKSGYNVISIWEDDWLSLKIINL